MSEVEEIVAKLRSLDGKFSDNILIGAILKALPDSFDFFQVVWRNDPEHTVDAFIKKIMAEANVQITKGHTEAVALAAKTNKKERLELDKDQCRYCKEKGRWMIDCPNLKTPYDPNRMKRMWRQGTR